MNENKQNQNTSDALYYQCIDFYMFFTCFFFMFNYNLGTGEYKNIWNNK